MSLKEVFSFPHPVNEVAARLVAGMVATLTIAIVAFDAKWLLLVLTYGFLARVLTGPTLSPMGLLATRVLVPRLGLTPRYTAGPPKRFAQSIGLTFSAMATVLWLGLGYATVAQAVLAVLAIFATLEAVVGFCAGCFVFGILMRMRIIPEPVCERCRTAPGGAGLT